MCFDNNTYIYPHPPSKDDILSSRHSIEEMLSSFFKKNQSIYCTMFWSWADWLVLKFLLHTCFILYIHIYIVCVGVNKEKYNQNKFNKNIQLPLLMWCIPNMLNNHNFHNSQAVCLLAYWLLVLWAAVEEASGSHKKVSPKQPKRIEVIYWPLS